METAYYSENDPKAAATLRELILEGLIAPGFVDERSIEDVKPAELMGYTQCHFFAGFGIWSLAARKAGWPDSRPLWTGSCPCQPFSQAGKGAGFADERHLWPAWFHLIQHAKPERVPIFGEQIASKDGLAWLDLVHSDLEGAKHTVWTVDLCAAGFGAPHIRQRLFFMAHAESERSGTGLRDCEQARQWGLQSSNGRVMGNAGGAGLAVGSQQVVEPGTLRLKGSAFGAAEPVRGFWRGSDWIWCRDGKYRAVEPGTFPLADGYPERVGILRGAGNAINSEVAAEFIAAAMQELELPS